MLGAVGEVLGRDLFGVARSADLELPFFEQWTGVPASEREYDVLFAFAKLGAVVEFPQPMSPRRKLAIGLAVLAGLAVSGFAGFRLIRN